MSEEKLEKFLLFIFSNFESNDILDILNNNFYLKAKPNDLDDYFEEKNGNFIITEIGVYEIKEYLEISKERERNLKIKIVKNYIENKQEEFTIYDIEQNLFFKKMDLLFYGEKIFDIKNGKYKLTKSILEQTKEIVTKKKEAKINQNGIDEFIKEFEEMRETVYTGKRDLSISEIIGKLSKKASKIHWNYLPIFSEDIMKNRGYIPEENLEKFYEHFHTLEDLYDEIKGKGLIWKTKEGDNNLESEMKFKVYSDRWKHEDTYTVKRNIFGWNVEHISINGFSLKNGIGVMFENLRHDSIFFPKDGVKHAFETLWEEADKKETSTEDLERKLQEIADWISSVEKNLREKQPDWSRYY